MRIDALKGSGYGGGFHDRDSVRSQSPLALCSPASTGYLGFVCSRDSVSDQVVHSNRRSKHVGGGEVVDACMGHVQGVVGDVGDSYVGYGKSWAGDFVGF